MWASARYDLGLSDADFWTLTLRELMALLDRHAAAEKAANVRATIAGAEVWALLANINSRKGKRFKSTDLFPFLKGDDRPKRKKSQAEMRETIEMMRAIWPSKEAKT